ncbi:unnamed protein product, partial [Symbiodinium necroappetens]
LFRCSSTRSHLPASTGVASTRTGPSALTQVSTSSTRARPKRERSSSSPALPAFRMALPSITSSFAALWPLLATTIAWVR